MARKILDPVRELGPIFLVAVSVALLSTLAGSVLDHVHQVDAEGLAVQEGAAVPAPDHMQTLAIKDWNVQFTLPLAPEMPLASYAVHDSSSVGFSAADLARQGKDCGAGRNALGALIRYPQGTYAGHTHNTAGIEYYIATVGRYDYGYLLAQNSCSSSPAGVSMINRETSVIREALSTLSVTGP